jgi:O-antigen/teichoic acid export membrane protein
VAWNIVWNWAGMVIELAAGFLVAPFLVRTLGVTNYGLWIVIGSLSGYFSLLDLGLRGSVSRQLAFHRANHDLDGANRILNSALAIFCSLALLTLVATAAAAMSLEHFFGVPDRQIQDARLALVLIGINLALSFPLQVFDGNLWAAQRFDILNWVDIPTSLIRLALTFAFIGDANDIVLLAVITLVTNSGSGVVKGLVSFRLDRSLRLHVGDVRRDSGKSLFAYGWWNFVLTVAKLTKIQAGPLMIGSLLGVALVTPFSIARRLQDYAYRVLWTATGVLTPVATGFHARSQIDQQQRLFVQGGKYSTVAAIFFVAYFACLGDPLIRLWMGKEFGYAAVLLIILSLGEFGQMTQSLTGSIIMATARHRTLAWMAFVEAVVSVTLIAMVARPFGLVGVCLALAVPQLLFSGVGTFLYGCTVTGVGVVRYFTEAFVPAFAAAVIPIGALALASSWKVPSDWTTLLGYSVAYTLGYVGACWLVIAPNLGEQALTELKTALFHS